MFLLRTIFPIAAALFGRWLQLHPDKVLVSGTFESPNAQGAILARQVIAAQGTFFVFGGITGAIMSLFSWSDSFFIQAPALLIGITCGILAAKFVRKEAREKAKIVPGQFGLWP